LGGINALRCIPDGVITFLGFTALRVVFFSGKGTNGSLTCQTTKQPSNASADNIASKTKSVRNIYDRVLENVDGGQTNNVVINLADLKAIVKDL